MTSSGWPYVLFAFLLGSIPFGLLVSRFFFKRDLRAAGSGNIGAANALRTLGKKAGAAVLVLDALKGAGAIVVAWQQLLPVPPGAAPGRILTLLPLVGLAAILGHCYTPWLRLRGGKGVATFLGAAFVLSWQSGFAFVVVWLGVVLTTGFSSLGSMLGTVVAGAVLVAASSGYGDSGFIFACGSALVVVWKHRDNLARLRTGTENRLSFLKR